MTEERVTYAVSNEVVWMSELQRRVGSMTAQEAASLTTEFQEEWGKLCDRLREVWGAAKTAEECAATDALSDQMDRIECYLVRLGLLGEG